MTPAAPMTSSRAARCRGTRGSTAVTSGRTASPTGTLIPNTSPVGVLGQQPAEQPAGGPPPAAAAVHTPTARRGPAPSDSVADAVAVAVAAYDLLTGGQLHRVKHCAQCHWLFLDRSKNGSRRWCSMEDCGASVKMRRYVARRAARRRSAPS